MQEFIDFANRLAEVAGEIVRKYYRTPFDVETKSDASPVTIADREIEQALRMLIERERPDDGILGEEFGEKQSQNGYTWVIDPIDGTKSFVIGRPTFGTLIALCKDGTPILGVIDQAIQNERWLGVQGQTTLFNGQPVSARTCENLANAIAASTTPAMFDDVGPIYKDIEKQTAALIWGADCYAYGLLANGSVDLVVEANMKPYDYLALVPIVEGAGGKITDWNGDALTLLSGDTVLAVGDKNIWESASTLVKPV